MDLPENIRQKLVEAVSAVGAESQALLNQRRGEVERQREDSRQRLKACEINRAAHEANMVQAAQLEHRIELDHRLAIERVVDAHFQSPLTPDQRTEIIRWLESQDLGN